MIQTSIRFRNFTSELLQREGALVEHLGPDGLEVLAPPHVQQKLRIPDLAHFAFGSDPPKETQRLSLESDWLERLGQLLGARGLKARCVLSVPVPALADPGRVVEHTIGLQNAVYDLARVGSAWTRYLILLFRYTAFSDEERDGMIELGLNTANGAVLEETAANDLLNAVAAADGNQYAPPDTELPPSWTDERLNAWIRRALPERIDLHLAPFVMGLQRRLDRDLVRVHGYYNDLRQEHLLRLQKRNDQARDGLQLEAIDREYWAKIEDLRQKYRVQVEVRLSQALELIMPVQRFDLLIKRRKARRQLQLDWNPLLRKLDTPPCEHTFTREAARVVCDDRLHLISPPAHGPCANCQKPYCRACHPRKCPKCDHAPG
jgi:hypothetical protein